jgi:hypothetical protein
MLLNVIKAWGRCDGKCKKLTKIPRVGSRRRWEDNIKIDVGEIGLDWIDLAQDTDRWLALVNMVMNLRVP